MTYPLTCKDVDIPSRHLNVGYMLSKMCCSYNEGHSEINGTRLEYCPRYNNSHTITLHHTAPCLHWQCTVANTTLQVVITESTAVQWILHVVKEGITWSANPVNMVAGAAKCQAPYHHTTQTQESLGFSTLPHLTYSPDLAPSNDAT